MTCVTCNQPVAPAAHTMYTLACNDCPNNDVCSAHESPCSINLYAHHHTNVTCMHAANRQDHDGVCTHVHILLNIPLNMPSSSAPTRSRLTFLVRASLTCSNSVCSHITALGCIVLQRSCLSNGYMSGIPCSQGSTLGL